MNLSLHTHTHTQRGGGGRARSSCGEDAMKAIGPWTPPVAGDDRRVHGDILLKCSTILLEKR